MDSTKKISSKRKEILRQWLQQQRNDDTAVYRLLDDNELKQQSKDLLEAILFELEEDPDSDNHRSDAPESGDILALVSASHIKSGLSPRDTVLFVFSLKPILITSLQELTTEPKVLVGQTMRVEQLIDNMATITMENFIRTREDQIRRNGSEITDLSTPVIKVWEGILVLPIIGTLDSARAQDIVENLLIRLVETESSVAILDISGVPAVDSLVAQHLIRTVAAARLMGAECIISGIRPEIAQTIVRLGVELPNINTKPTLSDALRYAFKFLGLGTYRKEVK